MIRQTSLALGLLLFPLLVTATPTIQRRQSTSVTALSTAQIASFKPYTHFASTAYCNPNKTLNWSCGANCNANPGFKPIASGGDGGSVQFWYVGFDPTLNTIIVAHQGTNPSHLNSVLRDIDVITKHPDPGLFPGVSSSIEVHEGFANDQAKTAAPILAAVKKGMSQYGITKVTIVGHSLGGALSLLDSVYLPLHLPAGTTFMSVTYGMPRVGNQAFANWVDGHAHLTHINNKKDPTPIVPGRKIFIFEKFAHPAGEVHIMADGTWVSCPGQDNTSSKCAVGDVPNIFVSVLDDHYGPYDGVTMGC